MPRMITSNANCSLTKVDVDQNVWGIYNKTTGEYVFADAIDKAIIDAAAAYSDEEDFQQFVQRAIHVVEGKLCVDIPSRVSRLQSFGVFDVQRERRDGNVLLIDPPATCEGNIGMLGPAMGLCYLSASLEQHNLPRAQILDARSVSHVVGFDLRVQLAYCAAKLARAAPRVVGITAVSATIERALATARFCKAMFPDAQIILGGPHASYEWRSLLSLPYVDFVFRGEGENSFPALIERLLNQANSTGAFREISGLAWKQSDGGVETSGWAKGPEDLDALFIPDPFRDLMNGEDYTIQYARIMSSRGCPFTCSFCSTATFTGRRVRYRSSRSILDEISAYKNKHNITRFSFDDDIFTVNKKRTIELCAAIAALPYIAEIEWGCNTRIDCIDDEIINALHRAGCRAILFGVESGDISVQTRFAKGKRGLEGFQHKIELLLEKGMRPDLNFIIGLPGENQESIKKIAELIDAFPEVPCAFNFLNVFPGTPLEQKLEDLGLRILDNSPGGRYSLTAPTLDTPTMSADAQIESYLLLQWHRHRRAAQRKRNGEHHVFDSSFGESRAIAGC